jgi:hypothetical protein
MTFRRNNDCGERGERKERIFGEFGKGVGG